MSGQLRSPSREVPLLPDFPELLRGIDGILWEADAKTFAFTYVSERSRTMLGYEPAEWLASPTFWADHLHPADREWAVDFCVAQTGQSLDHEFEYRFFTKDGRVVWVRDLVWVVRDAEGHAVRLRGLLTDITARKNAEVSVAVQQEASAIFARSHSFEDAVAPLLASLSERMGWQFAAWWRPEAGGLRCAGRWAHPRLADSAFTQSTNNLTLPPGTGLVGRVFANDRGEWVEDFAARADHPRAQAANASGLHGAVAVPIQAQGRTLGVLEFYSAGPLREDSAAMGVLEAIAAQAALFVEQRKAARELQQSHALKGAILATALDCIITIDGAGQVVEWNDASERTFGFPREEAIGRKLTELIIPPELRTAHAEGFARHLATGETRVLGRRIELPALHKNGARLRVEIAIVRVPLEGEPLFTAFLRDVTEQRAAEEKLKESEHRMRQILDSVQDMVFTRAQGPGLTFANKSVCDHMGRSVEQLQAASREAETGADPDADVWRTGRPVEILEEPQRDHKGSLRYFHTIKTPVFDTKGNVVEIVSVARDVTARRREKETLDRLLSQVESQRRRLDDIITSVPGVVWEAWGHPDAATQRTDFVSEHVERMLGYTREEWLATPNFWLSIVHPEDRERAARQSGSHFTSGVGGTLEFRWRRKDGSYLWVQAWNMVIKDEAGAPVGMRGVTMDISARKQAEGELHRVSQRLEQILESAGEGIYGVDGNGVTTFMNAAALEATGLTAEQAIGRKLHEIIHGRADGSAMPESECKACVAARSPGTSSLRSEDVFWRVDGTSFPVEFVTTPISREGSALGSVTVFKDITERRQAEAARDKDRRLFTTLLNELPAGVLVAEMPTGKLILANKRVNEILGHEFQPAEGIEQYAQYEAYAPDGRRLTLEELPMTRTLQSGVTITGEELHYRRADGSLVPLLVNCAPVHDAQGNLIAGVAALVNISDRKRIERQLRVHTDLLAWQRRVLESIATGAPLHDTLDILCRDAEAQAPDHHFTVLLADEEGKRLRHGAAPSLPDHYNAAVDGIAIGEGVGSCGTAAFRKEPVIVTDIANDPLWKEFKGLALPIGLRSCWSTPLISSTGKLLGTWAVYRRSAGDPEPMDQTMVAVASRLATIAIERSQAEGEVRYQRDLVSTITDNAGSALFMMDAQGFPMFLNDAAKAMTGYASVDEIKDRPLHYAVHFLRPDGSHYPMEECPIDQANAEIVPLKDQREVFCRKDGSLFPVAFNVAPVTRDGKQLGAVIEVRDITEELRAENELRDRAEELAKLTEALQRSNQELDQFAYVTSHDLKAPLRGISNLSRWIEEDMGERVTPESRNHLDLLRGRAKRMDTLIDAILEYSRIGRVKAPNERVDVSKLLRETVDLISPPERMAIEIPDGLPVLTTQRTRLQQVFMNLIGNAVKHHDKPDGHIRIDAKDAGAFWEFTVSDDGPGISPRFHEKIFVIFQTLQPRDKVEGTGVGLALVKKIVESQGGSIRLDSDEGRGATFRFTWPKQEKEAIP